MTKKDLFIKTRKYSMVYLEKTKALFYWAAIMATGNEGAFIFHYPLIIKYLEYINLSKILLSKIIQIIKEKNSACNKPI